ncbi:hypothetical protein HM25_002840 [Salmonella enterica subsp. enterica serovar Carno]|nr:hypothetical protein [Salmonella enterica]EDP9633643.1 hypothetical protein [Salmonella enterica subsp. enterica]EDV9643094.1 hypothetical protein [Salmonella enterica subsp. enterica serovar Carno]
MGKVKSSKSNLTIEVSDSNENIEDSEYRLIIQAGQAEKISPKAMGNLTWQLAISGVDQQLYLRLIANGSGGLFSKDWISLSKIESLLEVQQKEGFTSSVFKPLFKGASANNAGFLAAVLRSPEICLMEAHSEKLFTHILYPDWQERMKKLNHIVNVEDASKD